MTSRKNRRTVHSRKNRLARKIKKVNGRRLLIAGSLLSLGTITLHSVNQVLAVNGDVGVRMINSPNASSFDGKEQLLENSLLIEETKKAQAAMTEKWEVRSLEVVKAEIERQGALGLEVYVVQWGDTLEILAEATGETVEHLAELNQVDQKDLILTGDVLTGILEKLTIEVSTTQSTTIAHSTNTGTATTPPVTKPTPEANIEIKTLEEIELLPFEVENKKNPELFVGEQNILQAGQNGEKIVHYKITLTNGVETGREVISEEITKQAVTQIVDIGSKDKIEVTEEVQTENIPFEVSEIKNDDLLKGESKIVQIGVNGEKVITYQITTTNGKETSREILNEKVTKTPVEQIVEVGTKVTITSKEETKEEAIAFETEQLDNPDLPKGSINVVQEGQTGVKTITYLVTFENNIEISREIIGEKTTKAAINKIVEIGTKDLITTISETQEENIAFETEKIENADLAVGETRVSQEGVNGLKILTYTITLTNGKETKRELVSEKISIVPVKEIIEIGTKQIDESIEYVTITFEPYWDEDGEHVLEPIRVKKGEVINLPMLKDTEFAKFHSWADYDKFDENKGKHYDSSTPIEEDVLLKPYTLRKYNVQMNITPPNLLSSPDDYVINEFQMLEGENLKGVLPILPIYDGYALWDWKGDRVGNYITEDTKVEEIDFPNPNPSIRPNWVKIDSPLPEIAEDELYVIIKNPRNPAQSDRVEIIKKGSTINLPEAELEGYVLKGWHDNQNTSNSITNETIFERNAELVPEFARKMTVRLFSSENELFAEIPHIAGELLGALPRPVKEGYIQTGWGSGPNGAGPHYGEGVPVYDFYEEPILNLYAIWTQDWRLLTTNNLVDENLSLEESQESIDESTQDFSQDQVFVDEKINPVEDNEAGEDAEETLEEVITDTNLNSTVDAEVENQQAEMDVVPVLEPEEIIDSETMETESVEMLEESTVVSEN